MRDHSKHISVNRYEAEKIILENCNFLPEVETVPVSESVGRVLAQDVCSKWDSPNTLTCRMDSIAVRWSDFENGLPDTSSWEQGREWEFANTGVAMPEGFDTAVVVEHVQFSDNDSKVSIDCMPSGKYAGTSAIGSKMKKGDILLKKGQLITPLFASLVASGNNDRVNVIKKPKVVFIPTGNELVKTAEEVPAGKNIESNSYMIAAKIKAWGGEPIVYDVVPDDKEALKAALLQAADDGDIVILNAGSSKGNDDWGIEMLEETGKVLYHQTNHGPGHHSSFGIIGKVPVIGISGPPGGAAFTTDFYVYPAVMKYLGLEPSLKKVRARLGCDIPGADKYYSPKQIQKEKKAETRPSEKGEFYSVKQMKIVIADDGVCEAFPVGNGSHPSIAQAEEAGGYYLMPSWEGRKPPVKGELIEIERRP